MRNGVKPNPKHLALAIRQSNLGIVQLLLQHGAELRLGEITEAETCAAWKAPERDLVLLLVAEHYRCEKDAFALSIKGV